MIIIQVKIVDCRIRSVLSGNDNRRYISEIRLTKYQQLKDIINNMKQLRFYYLPYYSIKKRPFTMIRGSVKGCF